MKNHETIPVGSVKQEFFPSTWKLQIQARNTDTTLAIDQHQGFWIWCPSMLRQTFETTRRRRCATQIGTCWTIQELPICVGECDGCVHVPYLYTGYDSGDLCFVLWMFLRKQFTVGVLTATLDLAALVLVGVAAFFGSKLFGDIIPCRCLKTLYFWMVWFSLVP